MVSSKTFLYQSFWYQNVRGGNRFEQASERFTRRCEITPMKSQKIYILFLTVSGVHTKSYFLFLTHGPSAKHVSTSGRKQNIQTLIFPPTRKSNYGKISESFWPFSPFRFQRVVLEIYAPKNWLVLRAHYLRDYILSPFSIEMFGSASVTLINHSLVTHKLGSYQNVAKQLLIAVGSSQLH